ncbi:hypothetical protein HID58_056467 [Brassica napus]|uniref:Uncharacterized protein n=1 Tax=Brassica napus TaxID=3708 RepID=A0ABQ8APC9_BRANA|nr:hypothetical protein HID58_056467 [Brassica napus]
MFVKAWAHTCKQENKVVAPLPEALTPSLDRSLIKDTTGLDEQMLNIVRSLNDGGRIAGSIRNLSSIPAWDRGDDGVFATLVLSRGDVEKLRERVKNESPDPSELLHLSTLVVAYAYVWTCLVKARGGDMERPFKRVDTSRDVETDIARREDDGVCEPHDMDFDDAVSAISADEELQLGQIYFALPLRWLREPLKAEEMAALAVKASSALMRSGGGGGGSCRRKCINPIVVSDKYRLQVGSGDDTVGSGRVRRKGRNVDGGGGSTSSGRRRKCYAAELSTIEE